MRSSPLSRASWRVVRQGWVAAAGGGGGDGGGGGGSGGSPARHRRSALAHDFGERLR